MPSQDELRYGDRNSLCGLITAVHEFADVAYQQRIWIEGKGPEISSYAEALCMLFDDYRIEEFAGAKARDFGFSEGAANSLLYLARVLDDFHKRLLHGLSDAEIIRLEGWKTVVAAAGRVLDSGALDWFDKNCDSVPMFPMRWRGRAFGETWRGRDNARESSDPIKVVFPLEDGPAEIMWADRLGENGYRLDNVPLFAYGINLGDTFLARTVEGDRRPYFDRTLTFSENQTVRITVSENRIDTAATTVDEMVRKLRAVSNGYETYGADYHVFSVPAARLSAELEALLDKGEDEGLWSWELSTPIGD